MREPIGVINSFICATEQDTIMYYNGLGRAMCRTNPNWHSLNEKEKIQDILDWIRERFETKDEENGTYALLELCKFYYNKLPRQDQTCLLLVYDNIDGLDDIAQNIIIEQINGISTRIPFKSIIQVSQVNDFVV